MKMPNLASRYHSGSWYFCRDSQSDLNGPRSACSSTCLRIAARSASYLLFALFQVFSIAAASDGDDWANKAMGMPKIESANNRAIIEIRKCSQTRLFSCHL